MKRFFALFLALLLPVTFLSGCGDTQPPAQNEISTPMPEPTAEPEIKLSVGSYSMQNDAGETTGYLEVARRLLTVYDASGKPVRCGSYDYDSVENILYLDDKESYTLEYRHRKLWMADYETGETFRLAELDGETIPEPTVEATAVPELTAEEVYQLAMPSTVNVTIVVSDSLSYSGTGFYDDTNGTVITNYHVIDGGIDGYITDSKGVNYNIPYVLGYDKALDIAVLATDATDTVPLHRRETPAVTGETVYALGSSLGLTGSFSSGIVSTAEREAGGMVYIQHTAAISHGNSGGPLLDKAGNVIGINCACYEDGQNVNLAIPIADSELVQRGEGVTLYYLNELLHSGSSDGSLTSTDWYSVCVGVDDTRGLYMSMPEQLYHSIEIDDDETGIETAYDEDAFAIFVGTGTETGDFTDLSDENLGELSKLVTDGLEQYGLEADPVDMQSGWINGAKWQIFSALASDKDMTLSSWLLVYGDEHCLYFVVIDVACLTESWENKSPMLNSLVREMISSLEIKN